MKRTVENTLKNKNLIKASFVIPTLNNRRDLDKCLKSIKKQEIKNKYEILVSDGGSTDGTLKIARKYKARVLNNTRVLAEPGIALGIKEAKGEILIILAVDNFFKEKNAVQDILEMFKDKKIFAVFPTHISADEDNLLTKYINTFTDPFNHFVYGDASNARTFENVYKIIKKTDKFIIYDFNSAATYPIIALAQGFSVRKSITSIRKNEEDDVFPVIRLIKHKKLIAFAYSIHIYHHTVSSYRQFIRKQRWAASNVFLNKNYGINSRAKTLTCYQKFKMYSFPIYSLSFIFPVLYSLFHYFKDRERMWFFHPIISFLTGFSISYEFVRIKIVFGGRISRA